MWEVRRKEVRRRARRPEKRLAEEEKEKGRQERTKRWLSKKRCVNLGSGDDFEEFSHVEDSDSCGVLVVTFWVNLVVRLSFCLL